MYIVYLRHEYQIYVVRRNSTLWIAFTCIVYLRLNVYTTVDKNEQ